jgi:hypothetical protein
MYSGYIELNFEFQNCRLWQVIYIFEFFLTTTLWLNFLFYPAKSPKYYLRYNNNFCVFLVTYCNNTELLFA